MSPVALSALYSILAALAFSVGGLFMKQSDGLTVLPPTLSMFGLFLLGAAMQTLAMRQAEMGMTYVVILGLEAVIALTLGWLILGETLSLLKVSGVFLICLGIVILRHGPAEEPLPAVTAVESTPGAVECAQTIIETAPVDDDRLILPALPDDLGLMTDDRRMRPAFRDLAALMDLYRQSVEHGTASMVMQQAIVSACAEVQRSAGCLGLKPKSLLQVDTSRVG
jgi:small multidrug resistance pump